MKNLKKDNKGFTIIEVLIVLAIAGLIMLVVFLAVPALQRNARNTQRKADTSAILGAVSEYANNNGGAYPVSGDVATVFSQSAPKLGYYTTTTNVKWVKQAAAAVVADPNDLDKVTVANFAKCSGNTSVVAGATARSIVLVSDIEGANGTIVPQCQES